MKIKTLIICAIILSKFTFAYGEGESIKDTLTTKSTQKEEKINRKYKLSISSKLFFENSSIDARILTSGNIDPHKDKFSSNLLESNVLAVQSKQGISYSKKAFANKIGYNISIYDRAEMDASFSKDLFDLIFFGNNMFLGQQLNLNNASLSFLKFQQIRFEVSRKFRIENFNKLYFDEVEVGLAYSYLIGNSYYSFTSNNSYIEFGENGEYINSHLNFTAKASDTTFSVNNILGNNGSGNAIDFILNLKKDENFLHFSLTDLGKINWNKDAVSYSSEKNINFSGIVIDDLLSLNDSIISQQLDSLSDIGLVEKSGAFSSYLPTTIHLAYKRTIPLKYIDYLMLGRISKSRKGEIPANYKPKYYIGSQFSLKGLYLRTSYASGGYTSSAWQLELGQSMFKKHFQFILGSQHFESIFKGDKSSNIGLYFKLNFLFGNINHN